MSLGLERAGFTPLLAFDIDERAVDTHRGNLLGPCIVADAEDLSGAQILEMVRRQPGEIDLLSGGPPCQGFSKQKRGAHNGDDRNLLVLEFTRLVREVRPRSMLFENVAIFGKKRGRKYLELMRSQLEEYQLFPHFYNCADYGLAQTRERFVMVGIRGDLGVPFSIPTPTCDKWKTVGEVLQGLPEPPEDYSVHPDFPNHQRARVTALNITRFSCVPQGGGWQDIPEELRLDCHRGVDPTSGGWPDVYGRLSWDGQCPTITGGFDSFTRGRYGHPLHDRPLTPREAARLQGFPDDYTFVGNRGDVRSQIGNVVPPPLADAVGREILRVLRVADGLEAKPRTFRRPNGEFSTQLQML
jgi:DNA (cytosine-5)-methyltransferase 1